MPKKNDTVLSIDPASIKMLEKAKSDEVLTIWDRYSKVKSQCKFGTQGVCCNICIMGPCKKEGNCGIDGDGIVARNLARGVAAGAAAHSDSGREIISTFLMQANGKAEDFTISNENKLKILAKELEIETEGLSIKEIAQKVGEKALAEFGRQSGESPLAKRAPDKLKERWKKLGVMPRGIDREIVETMHQTHVGMGAEYKRLIYSMIKSSLADGWGGSMFATEFSDILFGSPKPIRSRANLGVIDEKMVNILVHGHEPILSEMIVQASRDEELIDLAKEKGAEGINIAGICCTANEILMRQGLPVAGNFMQQELAIITGAVETMVVDVQCILPSLSNAAKCYHTKLITTSDKATIPNVEHKNFEPENALENAKHIVREAVENFSNRKNGSITIPDEKMDLVAGFTAENVYNFLGGTYRSTYRPLNDAIIAGRIRGVVGVVGCNNPKICHDYGHVNLVKELLKKDVLVVQTGCSAIASAKAGLLKPESAFKYAGKGLQEICEAVGIPPVLHVGSCVDNSRILIGCCEMVKEGGIGDDICELPVAAAAPEAMSEKSLSISAYAVGSGIFTVYSPQPKVSG
ncbi:MAG: anaerobic carbon-monoxide dehydrogenase catalytic subunit, partial [bacterium]|nr:anaerobic carbon-monoxide dehydrogenase catalytic subunit [bacterium]